MSQKNKKLVAGLVISILMTEKIKEKKLEWIPCIWYPVTFKNPIKVLLDSRSKINTIS